MKRFHYRGAGSTHLFLVFDIKELVHLHHGLHNSGIVTIIMADELTNLITDRSKYLEVVSFHCRCCITGFCRFGFCITGFDVQMSQSRILYDWILHYRIL